MNAEQLNRLRRRAHVHTDHCYGRYEPCGEHHMHDDTCGSRSRLCRQQEDDDLVALLAAYDQVITGTKSCPCKHTVPCHERCACVTPLSSSGCSSCCSYGSPEQQGAMARRLAKLIGAETSREREIG